MNKPIIGVYAAPCQFYFLLRCLIRLIPFLHNIRNHKRRRPRHTRITMHQHPTHLPTLLNHPTHLIKQLTRYLLRLIIMNIIKVVLTVLGKFWFKRHCLLANRDYRLDVVLLVDLLVHGGVAVAQDQGAQLLGWFQDAVAWLILGCLAWGFHFMDDGEGFLSFLLFCFKKMFYFIF